MERVGKKNYSRRYERDNFVTPKIQFTISYYYYFCNFLSS